MSIGDTSSARTPRQWRWVFGAVWLIFLVYPLTAVATVDRPMALRVVGVAVIVAFAVVYIAACVVFMNGRPGQRQVPNRVRLGFSVVLGALTLALFPIIHEQAFGLAGFLMAIISFIAPRRLQIVVIVSLVAAAWLVPRLFGWTIDFGVVAIMAAIGTTMIAIRAISERESERESAEERQRELNAELAVVAERERVARDVHDILGHSLTVISVKTELAGRLVDLDPERAKAEIDEVNALAREALAEVRSTVGRLRTPELPTVIASAGSALAAAGIAAELPDADVQTPNSTLFAWVLREAVTNVVRHSGASTCRVVVVPDAITIADDGDGSPLLAYGNGLRGLSERVAGAGGTLTVDSDVTGTTISARVVG
ncbi:hypothetical protein nbrc107696_07560 [Gordonia spumicola]|uniref:Signal transduction histidine kinase subgroup 3 dimerisation and phosphoacceptor domain-containing protein n=1 Tax=Gordonia spumicola TaxID=589161 RepID=A0A7I9V5H6_9ACTN|nr:histidine kinase [Gordonia spumicola]GEE00310.1 hypothetical protein nbrc107696_07560 [Gordonia spumicola]